MWSHFDARASVLKVVGLNDQPERERCSRPHVYGVERIEYYALVSADTPWGPEVGGEALLRGVKEGTESASCLRRAQGELQDQSDSPQHCAVDSSLQ